MSLLKNNFLIFAIGIILLSGCSENSNNKNIIFVLFHHPYSLPHNFFVAKFNLNHGKGDIVCPVFNIDNLDDLQKKILFGEYKNGFSVPNRKTRYKIFFPSERQYDYYEYDGRRYPFYQSLIDSFHYSLLKRSFFLFTSTHLTSDSFYYTEAGLLIKFDLLTRKETTISDKINAVAITNSEIWGFYNYQIKDITGHSNIKGQYSNMLTEAGFLAKHWIWFHQKMFVKDSGDIWIMNTLTGKTHLARYWWSERWGYYTPIMNLERKDLEHLPCKFGLF